LTAIKVYPSGDRAIHVMFMRASKGKVPERLLKIKKESVDNFE